MHGPRHGVNTDKEDECYYYVNLAIIYIMRGALSKLKTTPRITDHYLLFFMDVRYITSADGTKLYADAVGDPSKPSIVFIHGFALSASVFDSIFLEKSYTNGFYFVSRFPGIPQPLLKAGFPGPIRSAGPWTQ